MLKTIFVTALIGGTLGWMLESCANADAKQPVPIQPGQAQACWDAPGALGRTIQCSDGTWQVTQDDGVVLQGRGTLPAEYQPLPAENTGPPPMSTYAPSVLFGIPSSR